MQLTGTEFTRSAALEGNDLSTFPDFPAEIRAPAGTLPGVSGYQVHFASTDIFTPGDEPDVLVAMNPAALRMNLSDLKPGGLLMVNVGAFSSQNLQKAGYRTSPLTDGSLAGYQLVQLDISKLVGEALADSGLSAKEILRAKNFYALGLMFWLYNRPIEQEIESIRRKFGKRADLAEGNVKAFKAGYYFGETTELFASTYKVKAASLEPGTYRNITGNEAAALGFVAAAKLSGMKLFLGSYPITPASDILHNLSMYRHFGVVTAQAEDEIAAAGMALGAAYAGCIGLTSTSGPGLALKSETLGLALMTELPLIVVDVQRGGPSTGLPTKTEQADLFQAIFGRNSESPVAVLATRTPADCFDCALEAVRVATKYMVPVLYLTDGYIANGAEPWRLPKVEDLETIPVQFRTEPTGFLPYLRDPDTLARPWAIPGTPGLEHRVGGLEKENVTGNVSYDPYNHELMVRIRAEKVQRIANDIPPTEIFGDPRGEILLVGWGGTFGSIRETTKAMRRAGRSVSHVHLRWLNPLPSDLEEIMRRFDHVVVPELNLGQLRAILRAKTLIDVKGVNKIQGKPFKIGELAARVAAVVRGAPDPGAIPVEANKRVSLDSASDAG
jgi:2-oxoglutarate ferredoxin oxidoreductase subunit alpha